MKKTPRILTSNIQFYTPPDDGFGEQDHEHEDHNSPITRNKEGGRTPGTPDYEKRRAEFLKKHSASQKAPVESGGDPGNEPNKEQIEQARLAAEAKAKREAEQKTHSEDVAKEGDRKRAGSNVPKIVEDKRQAEKERDDFKAKVEEWETKTKPEYEKKITDLQAKIDSGNFTPTKEKEFQEKIENLERQKKEREDSLVTENKELRGRLDFYDIQSSPDFQKEYIDPVVRAHTGMVTALNGNKKHISLLQQALSANALALNAGSDEERQAAVAARGEAYRAILNEINDEVLAEEFRGSFREYLQGADRHKKALADHEGTKQRVTKEAKLRADKAYADQLATWGAVYDAKAAAFKEDEVLSKDELDIAKDLGLDPLAELKRNNHIASKVIVGQTSMDEAVEIVHNGRVAPILRARNKILEAQVADLNAVIEKLRGSGTGGGQAGGQAKPRNNAPPNAPKSPEGEPLSRDKWQDKFRPK